MDVPVCGTQPQFPLTFWNKWVQEDDFPKAEIPLLELIPREPNFIVIDPWLSSQP